MTRLFEWAAGGGFLGFLGGFTAGGFAQIVDPEIKPRKWGETVAPYIGIFGAAVVVWSRVHL